MWHGWRGKVQELVVKTEDKTELGRTRRRWENNIKTHRKEIGQEIID
jgi:hypothetical protein